MFERFTESARAVVRVAQEEARGLGHGWIGTEHLLLGLVSPEGGLAAAVLGECGLAADAVRVQVRAAAAPRPGVDLTDDDAAALRTLGIDLDAVVEAVEGSFGPGALRGRHRPKGHLPLTKRAKKCLELSLREAAQRGDGAIGPEHLLLGVLREGEGLAAKIMVVNGLALSAVRETLLERLGRVA